MGTIRDFLRLNGNSTFKQVPFCEADVIVLNILSYANFKDTTYYNDDSKEGFINLNVFGKAGIIKIITKNYITIGKSYTEFLKLFFTCSRYNDVKIGYFYNYFSTKKEAQFFGMTFLIDEKYFIIFRGTDNTIVGWKEDFNLALLDEIPAQIAARNYAKKMLGKFDNDFYISGHSKGGNLAYFTWFNLSKKEKKRITYVYNLDGPGFKEDKFDYKDYGEKIIKIVPEDDIVGCLFDNTYRFDVVPSKKMNIGQHDMLTWIFDRKTKFTKLKRVNNLTIYSQAFKETANVWYKSFDYEQVKTMVSFIFALVDTNNSLTLGALVKDLLFSGDLYYKTVENYDEKTKKTVKSMIRDFFKLYLKNLLIDKKTIEQPNNNVDVVQKEEEDEEVHTDD